MSDEIGENGLRKVLPEFELRSVSVYPNNYSSVAEFKKEMRSRGWNTFEGDVLVCDRKTYMGITSYQRVFVED